ncbi:hypothetical protein AGABI2DRAFT_181081, partial [Agaricus bisporus var. bisporus H97]|uniref:hypothetical protein n=1 Tax=Agaricus bisporus var. bisporus (strain H97 / ATCC MYA-4626 / FGSC 10389) TaxID=936046 RepID=UPI00029F6CA4
MIDDDIQYLGSRLAARDNPLYPHRTLTGAALHIEKSDGTEAYSLTYDRQNSATVYIGRRPGNESESRTLDQEKGRAMFRCAVVSRRHAKIAFSDSGNVYIIDLGSHHGTHVRKPGETSSKMLERDLPTALSDGDIVTFGKTVGRNEEVVRPIVARVQLIHGSPSTSPIKPLVVPDSPSVANRSHTGRYGLRSPSSSSLDEPYDGQSDCYSSVEEIFPPSPASAPIPDPPQEEPKPEFYFGRAIEAIKRLLPPSVPLAASSSNIPERSVSPRLNEQSPYNSHSPSPVPEKLPSPSGLLTIQLSPSLPRFFPEAKSFNFTSECLSLPPLHLNPWDASRSESPMELASSSASVPDMEPPAIDQGDFCIPSNSIVEDGGDHLTMDLYPDHQLEEQHENEADAADGIPIPPWHLSFNKGKEKEKEKEANKESEPIDTSLFVTKSEYEDLKTKYAKLQDEIGNLQTQRRKYKAKFNSNVHTVTDKFLELEDKMNDMGTQCTLFMDQIESVTYGDVPDLQTRIDDLLDEHDAEQMEVGRLRTRLVDCEEKVMRKEEKMRENIEEVKEGRERVYEHLDTLRGLVEEMKTLRNTTEREVKEEVETLRQIRKAILEEANATDYISVKRKRSAEDDGEQDVTEIDATSATLNESCSSRLSDRSPRHKRPRRVTSILAQTATAVTMGAVATWAALAFY